MVGQACRLPGNVSREIFTVKQICCAPPSGAKGDIVEASANATGTMQEPESSRDFAAGFLLGILVGEGHFGGDGKQPQVTLRMHARHASLFRWILTNFPGGKLYGPYHHSGRHYFQSVSYTHL